MNTGTALSDLLPLKKGYRKKFLEGAELGYFVLKLNMGAVDGDGN